MNLQESTSIIVKKKADYYKQWVFDDPLIFKDNVINEIKEFQSLFLRVISHFINNYEEYKELMPLSPKLYEVINIQQVEDYDVGTYRTDFVYDNSGSIKIIEITCRFALNGMFLPAVMDHIARRSISESRSEDIIDVYSKVFEHLESKRGACSNIVILVGDDKRNESKLYVEIYEQMGLKVEMISYKNFDSRQHSGADTWFILELAIEEIELLSMPTIKFLCKSNSINDFRTILLLHDKRFFGVLNNENFLSDILTEEEKIFFEEHLTPTFSFTDVSEVFLEEVRAHKSSWIIKHRSLGKSQSVYAGIVTTQEKWDEIMDNNSLLEKVVFQKWVPQKRIAGTIEGKRYEDFLTGTLLFVDEHFFGFGDFRTSSFPVTNVVDHRKMTSLILR